MTPRCSGAPLPHDQPESGGWAAYARSNVLTPTGVRGWGSRRAARPGADRRRAARRRALLPQRVVPRQDARARTRPRRRGGRGRRAPRVRSPGDRGQGGSAAARTKRRVVHRQPPARAIAVQASRGREARPAPGDRGPAGLAQWSRTARRPCGRLSRRRPGEPAEGPHPPGPGHEARACPRRRRLRDARGDAPSPRCGVGLVGRGWQPRLSADPGGHGPHRRFPSARPSSFDACSGTTSKRERSVSSGHRRPSCGS